MWRLGPDFLPRTMTALIFGGFFWAVYFLLPVHYFSLLLAIVLCIILLVEWRVLVMHQTKLWFLMPLYPVTPFLLLIALNEQLVYRHLLVYLFAMVFTHDSGSYIVGTMFGKTKIWPEISSGKSWQGFMGGFLCTQGMVLLTAFERHATISLALVVALSFCVCSLALVGDFFESFLKRRAGIKHSGSLLPGHGGLLDRFDGILFAAIFFYVLRDTLCLFLL